MRRLPDSGGSRLVGCRNQGTGVDSRSGNAGPWPGPGEGRAVTTDVLLLAGVAAAVVFVAVLFIEGAVRPGYDPIYHTGSELELGDRGWIQRANFFVMGAGVFAFAVGVERTLDSTIGAVLVAIFGLGLIAAGMFTPDPVRGYPPGAPPDRQADLTWQAQVHDVSGPVMFLALLGACLVLAVQLGGGWRLYTMLTAGAGLVMTVWTAVAYQKDAENTGLVQRGLILVYWSWIAVLGVHLATDPPQL